MAKRKKRRRRTAAVPVVHTRKKKGFVKGESYRINVPGVKAYGVFERTESGEDGKAVHVFRSMDHEDHFHIPVSRARGIYRMATETDWKKFSDERSRKQNEMVRRYGLSISDRTIMLNNGVRTERELQSARVRHAVEKLTRLGLLQKDSAGHVLTPEGLEVGRRIFSSSSGKGKKLPPVKEEPCESQAYTYDEYMKLLKEESDAL